MKNIEITTYELIGLIKDSKEPSKVIYQDKIYQYNNELCDYDNSTANMCLLEFIVSSCNNWLDEKVEILERTQNGWYKVILEENNKWEDICELLDDSRYNFSDRQNDMTQEYRRLLDSNFKTLGETINQLIKNQKYLKERIDKNEK